MEGILVIGFVVILIFLFSRPKNKKNSPKSFNKNAPFDSQLIITDEFKDILELYTSTLPKFIYQISSKTISSNFQINYEPFALVGYYPVL